MSEDRVGGGRSSRFRTRHDWEVTEGVSTTIVNAVSAVVGKAPTDLRPLYDTVDPDALDSLVRSLHASGNGDEESAVVFSFNECEVTIEGDGTIWIELAQ